MKIPSDLALIFLNLSEIARLSAAEADRGLKRPAEKAFYVALGRTYFTNYQLLKELEPAADSDLAGLGVRFCDTGLILDGLSAVHNARQENVLSRSYAGAALAYTRCAEIIVAYLSDRENSAAPEAAP